MKTYEINIEDIIETIYSNYKNCDENYIIGLDGYSCAGKTSLTKELIERIKKDYPVKFFHIDDHIVTREERYNTGKDQWYEYFYIQWNEDYISNSLLKPLKNNDKEVKLKYYNKDEDNITERKINIPEKSIVIIEGVFLQRNKWRDFFDFVFFIDCPREIRFERELIRSNYTGEIEDIIDKYKERYWAAEDYYEKTYNPLNSCDVIIKNY